MSAIDTVCPACLTLDYMTLANGTLSLVQACPVPCFVTFSSSPSHLFQRWSLWHLCHDEHAEPGNPASYVQASGVDVGV